MLLFLPLDPDPDPNSQSGSGSRDPIESGSNPDPDPKHWLERRLSGYQGNFHVTHLSSVADPDPCNPYNFPGSRSVSIIYFVLSGSGVAVVPID